MKQTAFRLEESDLAQLDIIKARLGVSSRSEALRRLIRAAKVPKVELPAITVDPDALVAAQPSTAEDTIVSTYGASKPLARGQRISVRQPNGQLRDLSRENCCRLSIKGQDDHTLNCPLKRLGWT